MHKIRGYRDYRVRQGYRQGWASLLWPWQRCRKTSQKVGKCWRKDQKNRAKSTCSQGKCHKIGNNCWNCTVFDRKRLWNGRNYQQRASNCLQSWWKWLRIHACAKAKAEKVTEMGGEIPHFCAILPIDKSKSMWYNGRPFSLARAGFLSIPIFHKFWRRFLCKITYWLFARNGVYLFQKER